MSQPCIVLCNAFGVINTCDRVLFPGCAARPWALLFDAFDVRNSTSVNMRHWTRVDHRIMTQAFSLGWSWDAPLGLGATRVAHRHITQAFKPGLELGRPFRG